MLKHPISKLTQNPCVTSAIEKSSILIASSLTILSLLKSQINCQCSELQLQFKEIFLKKRKNAFTLNHQNSLEDN